MKNNKVQQKCIYCGENNADSRDHVPPRCFFPKPWTNDFITVPSCIECNRKYGMIDEYVRDILINLYSTESIKELQPLREKVRKSMDREDGKGLLFKLYYSIRLVGNRPAFDMERVEFDLFFERIARAFLYKENGIGYFNAIFQWKNSYLPTEQIKLTSEMKMFLSNGIRKSICNGLVKYLGLYYKDKITSLLIINFYGGIEFMVYVKEIN